MNERYIEANGLLKSELENGLLAANLCGYNDFVDIIADAPTADVVKVVRCEKCAKRNTSKCPCGDWTLPRKSDYCSYGEPKEG